MGGSLNAQQYGSSYVHFCIHRFADDEEPTRQQYDLVHPLVSRDVACKEKVLINYVG